MKLSDVRGERVLDVVAEIIDPIVTIASDEKAAKLFHRDKCPEDMKPWQFFLQKVKESLPSLIRNHKAEFVKILSAIQGVPEDEYLEGLTFASLFSDLTELVTDREFMSFFE